jgi:predicted permease
VAIGFACFFGNSLLLGLAISEQAYGSTALAPNYAIIAIHSPFCYIVGITAMEIVRASGHGVLHTFSQVLRAVFSNSLMIGIGLGFVVNLSGFQMPSVATQAIDIIAQAALPAALFAMGGVMVQYRPEGDLKEVAFICLCALFIHPSVVWVLAHSVVDLTTAQLRGAIVTAAMAPGANVYVFANMYGVARRVAATSVLLGTAISILTASAWLSVLP